MGASTRHVATIALSPCARDCLPCPIIGWTRAYLLLHCRAADRVDVGCCDATGGCKKRGVRVGVCVCEVWAVHVLVFVRMYIICVRVRACVSVFVCEYAHMCAHAHVHHT